MLNIDVDLIVRYYLAYVDVRVPNTYDLQMPGLSRPSAPILDASHVNGIDLALASFP